jgi:SnoaL-like protein
MKMRLLLTLAGFAIGFAVPALAQEQNTVNPEVRQQIEAALMKYEEAFNKHDAAAMATLFTLDAVQMLDWGEGGTFSGQQAIEKYYAVDFASSPPNSSKSLFSCMQSVTRYPLSRNGVTGNGRATTQGSMFVMPTSGRSAWISHAFIKTETNVRKSDAWKVDDHRNGSCFDFLGSCRLL